MKKYGLKGWLYLLPAILFLGAFMVYPLIDVFVYSFEEGYNSASQSFFGVGAYNYAYVLRDEYFLQALKNTFLLVVITVPLSTGLALLISVALGSIKKLRELFQTIYFLPYVTNTLAVGLVFMILFKKTAYTDGLVNLVINFFGSPSIDFIEGPYWAKMFVLCFYTVWVVMPFKILILTSALASVRQDFYNAARLDATPKWRVFTRITLPMISPQLFYLIITGSQRRRHEHDRGLCLRHALRQRRRLAVLCLGRGDHPLCDRADDHLHQPACQPQACVLRLRGGERMENINRGRTRARVGKAFVYLFLAFWAILVLFPFYWMVLTSIKSYGAYNGEYIPRFFTPNPTMENYAEAFTAVPLGRYFLNTVIFTLITTALMLIVTVLAAFAFSRLAFRGKDLVFTFFLALMMIPSELVVITNFQTITNAGLRNTFTGLILPSVTSVFYIYLLKENFEQIPDELYRAAKVDGTTDFHYLTRVMIPICRPTIITVTILKVIECWNSFVWPRLITDDTNYFLVSNGIQSIRENGFGRENIPAMMAAVVVISVPLVVLFLLFRKKIMAGVSRGGTKG